MTIQCFQLFVDLLLNLDDAFLSVNTLPLKSGKLAPAQTSRQLDVVHLVHTGFICFPQKDLQLFRISQHSSRFAQRTSIVRIQWTDTLTKRSALYVSNIRIPSPAPGENL